MANTSVMWQQDAHTTHQLSSPSCSTRARQNSTSPKTSNQHSLSQNSELKQLGFLKYCCCFKHSTFTLHAHMVSVHRHHISGQWQSQTRTHRNRQIDSLSSDSFVSRGNVCSNCRAWNGKLRLQLSSRCYLCTQKHFYIVLHPISEVSPTLPLNQFQCSSPIVISRKTVSVKHILFLHLSPPGNWWCGSWLCACR